MHPSSAPVTYRQVSTPKLHEGVVQQIVTQIMSGAIEPSTSLPSEALLAQQFGVSRTVIREAVRLLVGKGLVAVKHGSGMQVQSQDQWKHLDPLILFERLRLGHDETLLHDLLELRRVVEVEVAALAALRHTPDEVQRLHTIVEEMRHVLDDAKAYTRLDIAFHETILVAARNRLLGQALRPASHALFMGRMISSQRPGGTADSERGHEEILAAIERGDQEQTRTAMRHHILQFENDIRTSLAEGFVNNVVDFAHELGVSL